MENTIKIKTVLIIIFILFFFFDFQYRETKNELEDSRQTIEEYQEALQQANENIEDAKAEAWTSYQEMGDALDNLNQVYEPY
jgi:FtsZ-binding cell division protein ZapB